MPTLTRDDGTPIVLFDAQLEISPFTLFRRLQQGRETLLVDVRPTSGRRTLRGSVQRSLGEWAPPSPGVDVVLFDADGTLAVDEARRLQTAGFPRVKALFGGIDLYEFSLDPTLLERDTFLDVDR